MEIDDSGAPDEYGHRRRRMKRCIRFNVQICYAYILSVLASALILSGFYLAFKKWDKTWLIFSLVGVILIFIGSCLYYCGSIDAYYYEERRHQREKRRRRGLTRRGHSNENLISSTHFNASRSVSQLSLNMTPQYFKNKDETPSGHTQATTSLPLSQIFSVNGQSFLILPISGNAVASSISPESFPMQNLIARQQNASVNNKR